MSNVKCQEPRFVGNVAFNGNGPKECSGQSFESVSNFLKFSLQHLTHKQWLPLQAVLETPFLPTK